MKSSFQLARVFGIPVRLHLTFLLFIAFLAMVYLFRGGPAEALRSILLILALFLSVTLHEFGHSLIARRFGVRVREIILLPIGGVSRMDRMPEKPGQELLVAAAGPLTSLALALALGAATAAFHGVGELLRPTLFSGPFTANLARLNLMLAAFNLLPGFPMDGGRILRAILATRLPFARATRIAAVIGRGFAVMLGIFGLFTNVWLVFIAIFIFLGASQEERGARLKDALSDIPASTVMVSEFQQLSPNDPVRRAVELAYHGFQDDFPVVEAGRVVGILTKSNILSALHQTGPDTAVSQAMTTNFGSASPTHTLDRVYGMIQACGCSSVPVVKNGRLVGMITLEALGRYMMFSSAAEDRRQ